MSHHHHPFRTALLPRKFRVATPALASSSSSSSSSSSISFEETGGAGAASIVTTLQTEDDDDVWRPTISDVERISFGQPAKVKGTGSRGIPHRLNAMEREWFQIARCKGYLTTPGSAYRSQRRDAPLINTYRNLCDARAQPSIVLHKQNSGYDTVVVDLSPLRNPKQFPIVAQTCQQIYHHMQENLPDTERNTSASANDTNDSVFDDPANASLVPIESWRRLPIYQLPPYCVTWETVPRSDAKQLCQSLAETFGTMEGKMKRDHTHKSKNIRHGKHRRHGGYGIEGYS
jgi:hypothetical protein